MAEACVVVVVGSCVVKRSWRTVGETDIDVAVVDKSVASEMGPDEMELFEVVS